MTFRIVTLLGALAISGVAAAQTSPLAAHSTRDTLQLMCAPVSPSQLPDVMMRVTSGTVHGRVMFSTGDPMIIDAGSVEGLRAGQRYYIRRVVTDRFSYAPTGVDGPISVHTVGTADIVQVADHTAVATVTQACDGVILGDHLEPYVQPSLPQADPTPGTPDYRDPAHVILGDDRRQMAGTGQLMLIDRGSDAGLHPGQFVTLYRETVGGAGPIFNVGSGLIMNVHPESALIRIESSRDAVYLGDLVAIHRAK